MRVCRLWSVAKGKPMTPLPSLHSKLFSLKAELSDIRSKLGTGHVYYSPGQLSVFRKERFKLIRSIRDLERKIHLHPDNHENA